MQSHEKSKNRAQCLLFSEIAIFNTFSYISFQISKKFSFFCIIIILQLFHCFSGTTVVFLHDSHESLTCTIGTF